MDIQNNSKIGSLNEMEPEPMANQNEPQNGNIQQAPRLLTTNSMNSMVDQPEEYYQVSDKKESQVGDQSDFLRMIKQRELKKKQNQQNKMAEQKANMKKKSSIKKDVELQRRNTVEESKKDRILKVIQPHVRNFKAVNNSNAADTEVTKIRSQCRQKIFQYLLFGIEELKELKENLLNYEQKQLLELKGKEPYGFAKTIVLEIDVQFVNALNSGNKQTASKKFKTLYKALASSITEETNIELRRKILGKEYTAKKLATMNDEQFLPPEVRQKLVETRNALLRQATATDKPMMMISEEQEIQSPQTDNLHLIERKKEEKKPNYKYLQESSIFALREMLGNEQIEKMRKLLEFENRIDIQERLVGNFDKIFTM